MITRIGLLGAGGMAREIICSLPPNIEVEYLYDNTITEDKEIVIAGKSYIVSNQFRQKVNYVIAVGYPRTKNEIITYLMKNIIMYVNIIHPFCNLANDVFIGEGSFINSFVTITSKTCISNFATINSNVTIGHDCYIGKMVHVSGGVTIPAYNKIGNRVFFGANSCTREGITICDDVIIGAGAVVVKNITEPGVYVGVPAQRIKKNDVSI